MAKWTSSLLFLSMLVAVGCNEKDKIMGRDGIYRPWQSLGPLFLDVQESGIFRDSKTFLDAIPKTDPSAIRNDYLTQQDREDFDLHAFVEKNFRLPDLNRGDDFVSERSFKDHLSTHWTYLLRSDTSNNNYSTLIPLPNPYMVSGGRAGETYYWESYFISIGSTSSQSRISTGHMLENLVHLIDRFGFVPMGNRSYYLSRSQPPFFAQMISESTGDLTTADALKYIDALQKEYDFWMSGEEDINEDHPAEKRVVFYNGAKLNRYWDQYDGPRPEHYMDDVRMAERLSEDEKKAFFRHLRASEESGWGQSSRWWINEDDYRSIRTTDILPIDLNCLIYTMEVTLWRLYEQNGEPEKYKAYLKRAEVRYNAINHYFWNDSAGLYQDIVWREKKPTGRTTAASFFPLFTQAASREHADKMIPILLSKLLAPGGIMVSETVSGHGWDGPYGWAPMQWIAINGLETYGYEKEARMICSRWLHLNEKTYLNTGKMMEKYNVVDTSLLAGGGEYVNQDGYGWTNGVALRLLERKCVP